MRSLVDLGEISLSVVDEGSGQPVLLLHGFPDSSHVWRKQIPVLAERGFRVIAPDLRGFGDSDKPEGASSYSMSHILADLSGLLDALGIKRAYVVGHDWGAITAWALAGWHPELVDRLVVISVGHPRAFAHPDPAQLIRSWYAVLFSVPGLAERLLTAGNWRLFKTAFGAAPDFDQYLVDLARPGALTSALNWYRGNSILSLRKHPPVKTSVMGIWGSKDSALGEGQMKRSEQYVEGEWRYERLDAGHWIPLRRADELNALLLDFLLP